MEPRERILTVRLMEKVNMNPIAAQKLGITVGNGCPPGQTEKTREKPERA